jgi:hypothetical protein
MGAKDWGTEILAKMRTNFCSHALISFQTFSPPSLGFRVVIIALRESPRSGPRNKFFEFSLSNFFDFGARTFFVGDEFGEERRPEIPSISTLIVRYSVSRHGHSRCQRTGMQGQIERGRLTRLNSGNIKGRSSLKGGYWSVNMGNLLDKFGR